MQGKFFIEIVRRPSDGLQHGVPLSLWKFVAAQSQLQPHLCHAFRGLVRQSRAGCRNHVVAGQKPPVMATNHTLHCGDCRDQFRSGRLLLISQYQLADILQYIKPPSFPSSRDESTSSVLQPRAFISTYHNSHLSIHYTFAPSRVVSQQYV